MYPSAQGLPTPTQTNLRSPLTRHRTGCRELRTASLPFARDQQPSLPQIDPSQPQDRHADDRYCRRCSWRRLSCRVLYQHVNEVLQLPGAEAQGQAILRYFFDHHASIQDERHQE